MNLGDKYALPVLLYLSRRIEMSLKGQPAMIVLDEAWVMLRHPVFRANIREWFKVLRKANGSEALATVSIYILGIVPIITWFFVFCADQYTQSWLIEQLNAPSEPPSWPIRKDSRCCRRWRESNMGLR